MDRETTPGGDPFAANLQNSTGKSRVFGANLSAGDARSIERAARLSFSEKEEGKLAMLKATKLSVALLSAGLMVGCASKSDITNLQTQIDGLKAEQASIKSTAEEALSAAQSAESKASSADASARRAAAAAEEVNAKLDRMFKKSMMK